MEHLCAEHSAACMRKYGNEPADIKPKLHPSTESLAARKTGRTVVGRTIPESSDEDQPTATRVNGRLSGRIKSPMPVDQSVASGMHAESSLAVQARQRVGQQRHSTSRSLKERPRGDASTPSTHRSKQIKAPPKPQDGRIYNSIHHFLNDVKAYSEAKSPAADLRKSDNHGTKSKGKGKAAKTLVMECGYPGCPFRIAAKSLQDAKGRDLEGFQVLSVCDSRILRGLLLR